MSNDLTFSSSRIVGYLAVNRPGIAYVLLHDQGGYSTIDNLSTDAPVPEPVSIAALGTGFPWARAAPPPTALLVGGIHVSVRPRE